MAWVRSSRGGTTPTQIEYGFGGAQSDTYYGFVTRDGAQVANIYYSYTYTDDFVYARINSNYLVITTTSNCYVDDNYTASGTVILNLLITTTPRGVTMNIRAAS